MQVSKDVTVEVYMTVEVNYSMKIGQMQNQMHIQNRSN
jgi:hypothetical protein